MMEIYEQLYPLSLYQNKTIEESIRLLEPYMYGSRVTPDVVGRPDVVDSEATGHTRDDAEGSIQPNALPDNQTSSSVEDDKNWCLPMEPPTCIDSLQHTRFIETTGTNIEKIKIKIKKPISKSMPPVASTMLPNTSGLMTNHRRVKPHHTDTLFWCMFIAQYGYDEYMMIGNHSDNKKLAEKQKIINFLQKNPQKIKETNIKITKVGLQEIMSDLMLDKRTSILSCIGICLFYNKNVIIVKQRTYIEFIVSEGDKTIVLYRKERKNEKNNQKRKTQTVFHEYEIDIDSIDDHIQNIKNQCIKMESMEKPLKGASAYTVGELENIASILDISLYTDDGKKRKKNELYEMIYKSMAWDIE